MTSCQRMDEVCVKNLHKLLPTTFQTTIKNLQRAIEKKKKSRLEKKVMSFIRKTTREILRARPSYFFALLCWWEKRGIKNEQTSARKSSLSDFCLRGI